MPPASNAWAGQTVPGTMAPAFRVAGSRTCSEPAEILPFPEDGSRGSKSNEITVAEVIEQYLEFRRLQRSSDLICKEALDRDVRLLGLFAGHFGTLRVSQCKQKDMTRFLSLHPEWKSPDAKIQAVGSVVTCFRWAEDEPVIDRCPYRKPKGVIPPPEPREAITPEEVYKLLAESKRHGFKRTRLAFRFAIWFMWETGCRTCEVRGVLWPEVDWAAGVIRHVKHKTRKKSGTDRVIPLTDRALRVLRWLYRKHQAGHIFRNGRDRPWTRGMFCKDFRVYARRVGIREEVSAYSLRHGFTVQALERGIGDRQIADVLGQASTRQVAWYGRGTRSKVDYLRENVSKITDRKE